MISVASLADGRLHEYRWLADPDALARAGLFVAEGRLVVRRLLATPRFRTRSVLVTQAACAALSDVLEPLDQSIPVYVAAQPMLNALTGFNMHRGCLAIAERPTLRPLDTPLISAARRMVVLEGVNNPDNVGGIFRSAAAFGMDAVIIGPGCSDPLYRKAVRTSMAATLQVPFADAGAWPDAISVLQAHGFQVIALTPQADATPLDTLVEVPPRLALLVGAEGEGLTPAALAATDVHIRVEMTGGVDSLNVTVAASIAMHRVRLPPAVAPGSRAPATASRAPERRRR